MIPSIWAYAITINSLFFLVGCSAWNGGYTGAAPLRGADMQSKSLAGKYRDLATDGSIKSHPVAMGKGGQATGTVTVGGPAPIPDLRKGEMVIKGGSGATPSSSGSSQDNNGSSNGTGGDKR